MQLGEIRIEVRRKDIRNVHLSVHPPSGRVRIAAPRHLSDDAIRSFAIGRLGWIRKQQKKLQEQERETQREYLDRETHYVWGRRCLLRVVERQAPPSVEWRAHRLTLCLRPGTGTARRAGLLEAWYRAQVRKAAAPIVAKWEGLMGVTVSRVFVRRMKTKWGSCNHSAGNIRLNTDLAKKPRQCLEYLVVHELAHLLERTHNVRFLALMDRFLPSWRSVRLDLNRLPVRHENWEY
ncbi:MAG: SprT family zinc-dependent metalloprotease [Acidobacteriota bacterium]